jgi:hypothetical protein
MAIARDGGELGSSAKFEFERKNTLVLVSA